MNQGKREEPNTVRYDQLPRQTRVVSRAAESAPPIDRVPVWDKGTFGRAVFRAGVRERIPTEGYIKGHFGVSQHVGTTDEIKPGEWWIFHTGIGYAIYTSLNTRAKAQGFVDALIAQGSWEELSITHYNTAFNAAVDKAAEAMGLPPRKLVACE